MSPLCSAQLVLFLRLSHHLCRGRQASTLHARGRKQACAVPVSHARLFQRTKSGCRCLNGYGVASCDGRQVTSPPSSRLSYRTSRASLSIPAVTIDPGMSGSETNGGVAPAFEMVVLGSGGGPLETDSSGWVWLAVTS
jgi:hypothetical protein